MFSVSGSSVRVYANGAEQLGFISSGLGITNGKNISWSNGGDASSATRTSHISEASAGVLQFGTTSANALGSIIAASGTIGTMGVGTSGRLSTPNVELSHATLASGTSAEVNFGGAAFQSVTATGTSLVLTGTGYPATGSTARSVTLFISASTASALTVSTGTSGWRFVGTGTAAAGKLLFVGMTATGSTGASVRAAFSAEQ